MARTMTKRTEQLRRAAGKAAKKATSKAANALRKAEQKLAREVRGRRVRRALRDAGELALTTGAAVLTGVAAEEAGRAVRRRLAGRRSDDQIGFAVRVPTDIERAAARVTDALKSEGFGVLTRVDVQATLREKLGVEFRPYIILGACNPGLAHRALTADPEVGLLLPCNVTLEQVSHSECVVRIADPDAMLGVGRLGRDAGLRAIADEAHERLARVREAIAAHPAPAPPIL